MNGKWAMPVANGIGVATKPPWEGSILADQSGFWAPAPLPPGRPERIPREVDQPNLETPVAHLDGWMTPARLFFQRNHFQTPEVDDKGWGLEVEGAVERPLRLTLSELKRMPATSLWFALECSGNKRAFFEPPTKGTPWEDGAVGNAQWTGVPLRLILAMAGASPDALEVKFTGADAGRHEETGQRVHFERSLPLGEALDPQMLVVYAMNGEPLSREHGGPVRLVVPGWYGMASVKWLTGIEVRRTPFRGPFQVRDYVYLPEPGAYDRALPVTVGKVNSIITYPTEGATVGPGRLVVRGLAWSGAAPVAGVEVSGDGGETWVAARLTGPVSDYGWRLWDCTLSALAHGPYRILARAADQAGNEQPEQAPWNVKGYGNNEWARRTILVSRSVRSAGLRARSAQRKQE